jgi:hypothetical protein
MAKDGHVNFTPSPSGKTCLVAVYKDGSFRKKKRLKATKAKQVWKNLREKGYKPEKANGAS